jgi:hypothetical protein
VSQLWIATGEHKARQIAAMMVKPLLNYVIRRFNLSSARLNKPQGLDLRWDTV